MVLEVPRLQVVIPAHRAALADVLKNTEWVDSEDLVVVTNGADPITSDELSATVLQDETNGVNISRWWNIGLAFAHHRAPTSDVLVLNADAQIIGDVHKLQEVMHDRQLEITYPDAYNLLHWGEVEETHVPGPYSDLRYRVTGYAFVVRASSSLRADERFSWWYGDDDLAWRAAITSGVGMVGDVGVIHPATGAHWNGIEDTIRADRRAFINKWGLPPHHVGPGADE